MRSLEDFREFYDSDLLPSLQAFEVRRKKICGIVFLTIAAVIAAIAVVFLAMQTVRNAPPLLIFMAVGGAVICLLVWWLSWRGFVRAFKWDIINRIVGFLDTSLTYFPDRHITESQFRRSRIFEHRIDRYRGEDHIAGKLGATDIEFSEVHAEYKTHSTGGKGQSRTHWHTIFRGLFCIADFNKHFHGVTVVLPDTAERLFGFLGKKLQSLNFLRRGELIKLEDPEFEKEFVVYGDDQVGARYILTPSLMQRISEFKRKTNKRIYVSFAASNVYVAIPSAKNMFEPRFFRTLLDFDMCREFFENLQLGAGIVEDLNLNTRIWTKE